MIAVSSFIPFHATGRGRERDSFPIDHGIWIIRWILCSSSAFLLFLLSFPFFSPFLLLFFPEERYNFFVQTFLSFHPAPSIHSFFQYNRKYSDVQGNGRDETRNNGMERERERGGSETERSFFNAQRRAGRFDIADTVEHFINHSRGRASDLHNSRWTCEARTGRIWPCVTGNVVDSC